MTRARWVALAVGLAVIAFLVLNGPALWWAVAYDRQEAEAVFYERGTDAFTLGGNSVLSGPFGEDLSFVVLRKRYRWLPGSEITVPDQTCPACMLADHVGCFPKPHSSASCSFPDGSSVDLPSSFRCICRHPSHAQESE